MLRVGDHFVSIMVIFAICLHLEWATLLLIDSSAANATALHSLFRYIPEIHVLALTVASAAILAGIGLWTYRPLIMLLLIPQQILLMMSAAGTIDAVWLGHFADGVIRPRAFIAADQCYAVLAAIGHTVAIIGHAMNNQSSWR